MNFLRLGSRLAVAILLVSASLSNVQAQVFKPIHRPVYTYYEEPVHPSVARPVKFGVRAGLNVADWSGEAAQTLLSTSNLTNAALAKDTKTGFHAGLYATIPLGKHFALEPGVLYSQKGITTMGTVPVQQGEALALRQGTATARMNYIDVPVLLKAYVVKGLYLYAGPQASYLMNGNVHVTSGGTDGSGYQQDINVKDQFRALDLGAAGGLGYQFDNGLGFSAGYDYGLSSLDKDGSSNSQNRVFKASANFSF
ncbi:porin family protein [Hymenobacter cavernae]|uniref:Outer membrane protein beta-barrel domain-containing protein n=1 Tax=Hymenobacter cavernae TaxID=2044852 RepID=A0ABQ1TVP5_9BACT|nr:porin family protein [Hymenobacter cavernae]GGF03145.1 hypothetical protein GCM10011383_12610 [Hymenobacter cavernae]